MKKNKIDYAKALEIVKNHREIAEPNYGFERQLHEFYLKEVIGIIKVPKKYNNTSYCSYNHFLRSSPVKKFKHSKPTYDKPKEYKIRTKKIRSSKSSIQDCKVKIFTVLDEVYNENKEKEEEIIQKRLEEDVKNPTLMYEKVYKKGQHRMTEANNKRKRKITNIITNNGMKWVEQIMKKNKK